MTTIKIPNFIDDIDIRKDLDFGKIINFPKVHHVWCHEGLRLYMFYTLLDMYGKLTTLLSGFEYMYIDIVSSRFILIRDTKFFVHLQAKLVSLHRSNIDKKKGGLVEDLNKNQWRYRTKYYQL